MSAFERLCRAYFERCPQDRPGTKVVGLVGATIPTEVVLAAAALPVAVSALPGGPTPVADRYLEAHFDDEVRAILEAALSGTYQHLDLLVLARSSDAYLELYYVLKELNRLGQGGKLPPLHLYDLLHGRSAANRDYGLARLRELATRLEAVTGVTLESAACGVVVAVTNSQRAAVNRLLEARRDPQAGISGVDAMIAIGAGRFLHPREHVELLDAYLDERRAPLERRPRVVLTAGVALADLRVHQALEAGGAHVVAEDDAWGSRAGGALIDERNRDFLAAVFDKYFLDVPSPRLAPAAARDEWLRTELGRDERPQALAVYIPRSDHWFGWDFPRLRALAAEHGLPTLLLRDLDPQPVRDFLAGAPV